MSDMGKQRSVRQQVLNQFPPQTRTGEPDDELASALYFLLGSIDDLTVDGWALFRVVHETEHLSVGLMTLL
jgi:predicted HAD superfamily Cof-like phosphohydrolase